MRPEVILQPHRTQSKLSECSIESCLTFSKQTISIVILLHLVQTRWVFALFFACVNYPGKTGVRERERERENSNHLHAQVPFPWYRIMFDFLHSNPANWKRRDSEWPIKIWQANFPSSRKRLSGH